MQIICLFPRHFVVGWGLFFLSYSPFIRPACSFFWGRAARFILKQLPEARGRQWYGETIVRVLSGRLNIAFIYRISLVYLSYIYRKNTVVVGVRIA